MSIFANYSDVHTHRLDAGLDAIINLPLDSIDSIPADGRSYSVGVHPWDAEAQVDWERLRQAASLPQVVAIGECGLDALRGPALDVQEPVFVRQARLAEELGKPLIVHCVRAYGRLMELRRALSPSQPWLVHGFRGKPELARQLAALCFE
ncbi:MAG: TatD family hydrolase, partial [Muribaculaceae bacterium]|nr:TatD family hydrolase [Muribaculaceae bacterium]